MCCFCNSDETVQHLFFDCALAKLIWRVIHLALDLRPLENTRHVFGAWVQNVKHQKIFFVGIGAIFWAIWLS
jgi:hypothetical protein